MRRIMLILLFSTGGLSYGEQVRIYTIQKGILEGTEQPRFRFRGYIAPDGYNPTTLEDIYGVAVKRVFEQMEWGKLPESDRVKEMSGIQAVYEKMSSNREKGTGQGIVIRGFFGQNQGDFSYGYLPESLTITGGDYESAPVVRAFNQMVRRWEAQTKNWLEYSSGAGFPQEKGENLERDHFFSFSGKKPLYNGLDALYENGMIGRSDLEEIEEIREKYNPFGQFSGTVPLEWAEISGVWTADEPEDGNQEAIRYFQFSEPIGGGGGGGGAPLALYWEKGEIEAYSSDMEVILFGYSQPRRNHWGKSLNYGETPASVFVFALPKP